MQVIMTSGKPQGRKKKKSYTVDIIIIALVLALLGVGGVLLFNGIDDYSQMKDMELTWKQMVDIANTPFDDVSAKYLEITNTGEIPAQGLVIPGLVKIPDNAGTEVEVPKTITDYLYRPINLEALRKINPDVSGYIYIPNTAVDYPILKEQSPGVYYYLNHNINREDDRYGSIFEISDAERDLAHTDNAVNIIFGHNMRSGAMFAGIVNYFSAGYSSNPVYIYRDNYRIEYVPFAACTVNATDNLYIFDRYAIGSSEYGELLDWFRSKNEVRFAASFPGADEPIIVLSTCRDASSDVRRIVCLRESRRAIVPEFYETLQEVNNYGGSVEEITRTEDE